VGGDGLEPPTPCL